MNQSIKMPGRKALEPLSLPLLSEAINRESTRLALSWLDAGSQPSEQLCVFAGALARTFLVRLGAQVESVWCDLYPEGEVVPHHYHFNQHIELVLILSAPQRQVAVRLRALALSLLEHHSWSGEQGFRNLFDDSAFIQGATEPGFDAGDTAQLAGYVGIRLTQHWPTEIERRLSNLTDNVLPVPRERVLQ